MTTGEPVEISPYIGLQTIRYSWGSTAPGIGLTEQSEKKITKTAKEAEESPEPNLWFVH